MIQPYKRRTPIPGVTEGEDRLMAMMIALTSQVAAMRERIDTLEALLVQQGGIPQDGIERFEPSVEDATRRDALRRGLIAKVMKPLRDDVARASFAVGERE